MRALRLGARALTAIGGLLLLLALLATIPALSGIAVLGDILMIGYSGAGDEALLLAGIGTLLNAVVLLSMTTGARARDSWVAGGLLALIVLNAALLIGVGFLTGIAAAGIAAVGLRAIRRTLRLNPVLLREVRGRMRGARAFTVLTAYVVVISGLTLLLYGIYRSSVRASGSAAAGEIGRVLFYGVVGVELLLILVIAPGFTAGAISGEREDKTFDLIETTPLPLAAVVTGKLLASIGFAGLLLIAAVPLQSLAFLFGGVGEVELLLSVAVLLATTVLVTAVGIYVSAQGLPSLVANTRTYGLIIIGLFAIPLVLAIALNVARGFLSVVGALSPPLDALLEYGIFFLSAINPITAGIGTASLVIDQGAVFVWRDFLRVNGAPILLPAHWLVLITAYLGAAALLVANAVNRLGQGDRSPRRARFALRLRGRQ